METRRLLKELLHRSGMRANDLATVLDSKEVTQSTISRFLSGKTIQPKISSITPIAEFFGINVEAFFKEDLAEKILEQINSGKITVNKRGATHNSRPANDEIPGLLEDWRLQASPTSKEVIDQLILLAKKNALGEEDWQLLEKMIERFTKR